MRPRVLLAVALGLVAAAAWPTALRPVTRLLIGWNVGVWAHLLLVLWMMRSTSAAQLQARARALGDGLPVLLSLAVTGALASMVALTTELALVKQSQQAAPSWPYLLLAGLTVAGTWLLLPIEFAMSYARRYHRGSEGPHGLEFPGTVDPDYWDFLYFSITLAATSQTSDVTITDRRMRRLVLVQALLSFVFNTGVLALSINLLAGLIG